MKTKIMLALCFMVLLPGLILGSLNITPVRAQDNTEADIVVFDQNNQYLFERNEVYKGDNYISKDYKMYEITNVDFDNKRASAKFIKQLNKPNVNISQNPAQVTGIQKNIALYMTHNDESYTPTDGYDSVYGPGGIHDVAKAFKNELENRGMNVIIDETLHIPHNSTAYDRSIITAKRLLNENNLNGLFDVHRDGVSRQYYAVTVDGKERSKVRMVVGKSNPKMDVTLNFALSLMAVGQELYPWLFADIYMAPNSYNQSLFEKAMLFEMGTYLIEKPLVINSMKPLAEVIDTTLFGSTVDENGDITIGGNPTDETPSINDHLTNEAKKYDEVKWTPAIIVFSVIGGLALAVVLFVILKEKVFNQNKTK